MLFGRFEAAFEARYYLGYSDVLRNGTKYTGNPNHSPLDNINLSLAIYYRLGKGGIRSAPSKGVARRMQEAAERRAQKRLERETGLQATDTLPAEAAPVPADSVSLAPLPPVGGPMPEQKETR